MFSIAELLERAVFRWLARDDAPKAAILALWFCTRQGQHEIAAHVGNDARLFASMAQTAQADAKKARDHLARVLAIAETGAANSPVFDAPGPPPGSPGARPSVPGQGRPGLLGFG